VLCNFHFYDKAPCSSPCCCVYNTVESRLTLGYAPKTAHKLKITDIRNCPWKSHESPIRCMLLCVYRIICLYIINSAYCVTKILYNFMCNEMKVEHWRNKRIIVYAGSEAVRCQGVILTLGLCWVAWHAESLVLFKSLFFIYLCIYFASMCSWIRRSACMMWLHCAVICYYGIPACYSILRPKMRKVVACYSILRPKMRKVVLHWNTHTVLFDL